MVAATSAIEGFVQALRNVLTENAHRLVNAPNKVPKYQKEYQQAYKQHTRLWRIHPRSPYLLVPYNIALWGCFGTTLWMLGRKAMGHNTMWGKD
ncbi:hypothetical protein F4780DRAFT_782952 [Xylariomycetidae sp. FL0641]|nr:hypothetical protein F4780DRAFT_782952 [Xylariomycetidae sp. FL0641]